MGKTPDEIAYLQQRTREVLAGGSRTHESNPDRDWIGNRWETGASKINVMLIDGATMEQLSEARGGVREHLRCLTHDLGLPVICEGGVYRFDRQALGVPPSEPSRPDKPERIDRPTDPRPDKPTPESSVPPTSVPPPADRTERLKRVKLVVEIGIGVVTLVSGVVALILRAR